MSEIFEYNKPFILESGKSLPALRVEYKTYGRLNAAGDNTVWICHALTANADAADWWPGFIGKGRLFDTDKYYIVCANIIGSCYGSSGPVEINPTTGKPYYMTFPEVTIRDMVKAHDLLRQHLGIKTLHTCVGGSLGGQQALEWGVQQPELMKHLILMATNAFHSAWGIAFNESQRLAIMADPSWKENSATAGQAGLKAARAVALLSYRSYDTYVSTQCEETIEKRDDYKASSYQNYQGEKLVKRFHTHAYWHLTKAMDSHHVGRGRGSAEKALAGVKAKTLVIGISSDVLFPVNEQLFISRHIAGSTYHEIDSLYGHDGFLIEAEKIGTCIAEFYAAHS